MDDQCCESAKNLEITAEHAVLIPSLVAVKSVMAYVEAVAVVIGSCHIHSVYEDGEHIKIYLNDKRFVDILVNNGVSILGRQMNVDYAVPRADKVILSNVDPIVPDPVLMKLLCFYGSPVSAIIHDKIATNSEYSHIECGKRKVYMKIFSDKKMPNKINFTFQDISYRIDVLVEQCDKNGVCEAASMMDERNEDEANDELLEVESNQSLKPNINELMALNVKQPTPKQLAYRNRGKKNLQDFAANAARKIKRRARGGWYASRITRMKRIGTSPITTTQNKGRAKRLVVEKNVSSTGITKQKGKRGGRVSLSKPKPRRKSSQINLLPEINPESSDAIEVNGEENGFNDQSSFSNFPTNEPIDTQTISQYPLSVEELEKFIFKTRFHREPIQVALEFHEDIKTPEVLSALKTQLLEYHNVCKEQALKLRIKRLVALLKAATDTTE